MSTHNGERYHNRNNGGIIIIINNNNINTAISVGTAADHFAFEHGMERPEQVNIIYIIYILYNIYSV